MSPSLTRRTALATAALALVFVAACGSASTGAAPGAAASSAGDVTLTVYTDQHAELVAGLTAAYTKKTGVKFRIQNDATVGQVESEGAATPADVFLSEDPAPVAQLSQQGLLDKVDPATLAQVDRRLSSTSGSWVGYAARARVLYYNPTLIQESALPKTLEDVARPEFKGKFAYAPSGAFVATTQYLLDTWGPDRTRTFLTAIKEGGVNEQKNGNVRDTVEAGKYAFGLSNHYYWWIKATEKGGADKMTSKIYHFPTQDPGNLVLSSGAGVLSSSKNKPAAAAFLSWLTAKDGGQQIVANGDATTTEGQYPVATGLKSAIAGSLDEIKWPTFDMDSLAKAGQAEKLLKELGLSN